MSGFVAEALGALAVPGAIGLIVAAGWAYERLLARLDRIWLNRKENT